MGVGGADIALEKDILSAQNKCEVTCGALLLPEILFLGFSFRMQHFESKSTISFLTSYEFKSILMSFFSTLS